MTGDSFSIYIFRLPLPTNNKKEWKEIYKCYTKREENTRKKGEVYYYINIQDTHALDTTTYNYSIFFFS